MIRCSQCGGRLAYKGLFHYDIAQSRHTYECKKCGKWFNYRKKIADEKEELVEAEKVVFT